MPRVLEMAYACSVNDFTLGSTKTFVVKDPMDAVAQVMEWRNLSWVDEPMHAKLFNVNVQQYEGSTMITFFAVYDGNTQRYSATLVPR